LPAWLATRAQVFLTHFPESSPVSDDDLAMLQADDSDALFTQLAAL
jgi:hypothetical protein